jgi:putative ABC transport system permease protein
MFRTALRNVLAHKARLLMTVLAVTLGVAFVSGTLTFTDTLRNAYQNDTAKSYENVAVAVTPTPTTSEQNPALSRQTLDRIGKLDGVKSVVGRAGGVAFVADRDGKLIGSGWSNAGSTFAPGKDGKDDRHTFVKGSGPVADGQIALDKDSAAKGGYRVGDTVRVATNGLAREYILSGIFTTDDGAVNAGGSLVLFNTAVSQRLYLQPGFYNDITVQAAPGASDTALRDRIQKLLPDDDMQALTGRQLAAQQADRIEYELSGLKKTLLAAAGVALFVGIFLISNTFTMLVAQRTKELALLRAVGASRRQVTRSVLSEALLVGAVASAAGFALGLVMAVGLHSAIADFGAKIPNGPLIVSPPTLAAALAVGVLVTMLAAWLPARRAAKIPPVAALGSVHLPATTKSLVVRNSIGALVTLFGSALILSGSTAGTEAGVAAVAFGAFFTMIGVIVLIPLLSRPVIALARPLLRAFGVSGTLAGRNAVRNPRRTGATASALAIGLTLITAVSVLGVSVGQALDKQITDRVKADYTVATAQEFGTMDTSAVDAVRKVRGATAVSPLRESELTLDGKPTDVAGVTPGAFHKVLAPELVSGSPDTLAKGRIAVPDEVARANGWKVGDTLPVTYKDKTTGKLTIGAIFKGNDFLSSYSVLVPEETLRADESRASISWIYVKMDGGVSDRNEQALVDALGNSPAFRVMDRQDIYNEAGGIIASMLKMMYALLAMALVIAVLGIINTMAMSVFERRQEIGMLRATGLDRRGVKQMVRLEAVVISLFGAVVGIAVGVFLGWALSQMTKDALPDLAVVLPWGQIGLFLLSAAAVGVLAAVWPARSAARLNMLTAIKTE